MDAYIPGYFSSWFSPWNAQSIISFFRGIAGLLAYLSRRKEQLLSNEVDEEKQSDSEEDSSDFDVNSVKDASKISLNIGYGLVSLVSKENEDSLVPSVTKLRKEISKRLGFVIPGIRIRDDVDLEPSQYQIKIGEKIVADDLIFYDKILAIPGDDVQVELVGTKVTEPSFGVEAYWIEPELATDAKSKGYVTIDLTSVLITHVGQVLNNFSAELLGQDEVQDLLDNLEISHPNLVQSVVPKLVPLHQLTSILQNLLSEAVPISDLQVILTELGGLNVQKMSNDDISEAVRPKLIPLLIQRLTRFKDTLPLITLAPELEQMILTAVRQNPDEKMLLLDGALAKRFYKTLMMQQKNKSGK